MPDSHNRKVLRRDMVMLGIIVGIGFLLRAWWVNSAPLHPDEYHYAYNMMAAEETASLAAIRDMETRFLVERRSAHPLAWSVITRWLWFLPLGWAVEWSPGFLRMPNVLMGTLLIPVAWAIMRVGVDRRHGIAAAILVAFCPGLIWISRTLYQDAAFTVWVGMMLLGGAWGMRSSTRWAAVLTGAGMGLALATKVSAPMLLPAFVVLGLMGAEGLSWRERGVRLAIATSVAVALFVAFCDPLAYIRAIQYPADPRYDGAISLVHAEHLLVGDADVLLNILLLDLPGSVALCLLAAVLAWREQRALFPALLGATLLCLSPLVLLHMPPLSGPHGFAPLYFVLLLLASLMVGLQPRLAMLGLLSASAGAGFTLALAREAGLLDSVSRAGVYPPRDALYSAVKDELHRRDQPHQILVAGDQIFFHRAWGIIRLAELTEGAIVLAPANHGDALREEAWSLADTVIMSVGLGYAPPNGEFTRELWTNANAEVWRRTHGEARTGFTGEELEPAGGSGYLLPGGLRLLAGRIAVDGHILPRTHQEQAPVSMDGRVSFADWRSGRVIIRGNAEGVELRLTSPRMDDVFWQY